MSCKVLYSNQSTSLPEIQTAESHIHWEVDACTQVEALVCNLWEKRSKGEDDSCATTIRLSRLQVIADDLMAYIFFWLKQHWLTLLILTSHLAEQRKVTPLWRMRFAHRHYTCNDTARHPHRTGPTPRSGTCRFCGFRYGWFSESSSSLEFLTHVCRHTRMGDIRTSTEPVEKYVRRRGDA